VNWNEAADSVLLALVRMVPETLRELAAASARDESEAVAEQRGSSEVEVDDVVRGWIRTTPPEQRNGLIAVIESLGIEPERYAEELESAEGWDEEFEEPPDSEV
jgi:hypothetical protein